MVWILAGRARVPISADQWMIYMKWKTTVSDQMCDLQCYNESIGDSQWQMVDHGGVFTCNGKWIRHV